MSEKKEIILPMKAIGPEGVDPRTTLIYAAPKQGKSSLLAGLEQFLAETKENYLIVDTEKGQHYLTSNRYSVSNYVEYLHLFSKIREEGRPYRYLAVDTITGLDDPSFIGALSLKKYRETPAGRENPELTDVIGLDWGLGYHFQREAFKMLLKSAFASIPDNGGLIMMAHMKDKLLAVADAKGESNAKDINLPGKLREIACSKVDAVGLFSRRVYAGKEEGVITFQTIDQNVCGLRCKHLKTDEPFVISQLEEDESITTFWEKIFTEL